MVWHIFGVEVYPWVTEYLKRPAFAFAVLVPGVSVRSLLWSLAKGFNVAWIPGLCHELRPSYRRSFVASTTASA